MGYRALGTISLGSSPSVYAGDEVPATYLDVYGDEQPVDFERLVELGVAEQDTPAKTKAPAKADDAESAPRSKRASSRSKE